MPETTEEQKPQKIDINDPSLQGQIEEAMELDTDADAFSFPAPPPDGVYEVRMQPSDQGWERRYSEKLHKHYLQIGLELRIVDPGGDFDDKPIFDNASDIVMQGTHICRIAGILKALGETIPSKTTNVELCRMFDTVLATNPSTRVKIRWEAYSKDQKKTLKRGMNNFPKNADGKPLHVFEDPNTKEEITANVRIQRYLPLEVAA